MNKSAIVTLFWWLLLIARCKSEVVIVNSDDHKIIIEFYSIPAAFGKSLPHGGLEGRAMEGHPKDGCSKMQKPPTTPQNV